jgi:hypothetical protein
MESAASAFDLNALLIPIAWLSGFFAACTGSALVTRSFFRFRAQVNQSIMMDIELVRVMKPAEESEHPSESWKKCSRWKLLEAIALFKHKTNPLAVFLPVADHRFGNGESGGHEEILFFSRYRKNSGIEKRVHSFSRCRFGKVPDYTIFTPGSATAVSTLELKANAFLHFEVQRVRHGSLDEFDGDQQAGCRNGRRRDPDSVGSVRKRLAQACQAGRAAYAAG